jgi:hypothetical protein
MPPLAFVGLVVALGAIVLIPTRRLFLAGLPGGVLTAYYLFMIALGLLVAELRGPARFLIPILVLAYIAPFITARNGMARLRDRRSAGRAGSPPPSPEVRRPPMKNVTPTEARPPDAPR